MCMYILSLYTHVCARTGRRDAVGALSSFWCCSQAHRGRQHGARVRARLGVQAGKSPRGCHLLGVTAAKASAGTGTLPSACLQCCPKQSSWSLTSAGFSCILSCSNKSEEAAPALESRQCRQMGSISPRPCCCR